MSAPVKLRLTPAQLTLLGQFAAADGKLGLTGIPARGRRTCVALSERGLLESVGDESADIYRLTIKGWTSLGLKPPAEQPDVVQLTRSVPLSPAENGKTGQLRPGSKLSLVVDLLRGAEGGSLERIRESTGWLPHTCRAALTGLRKRGYQIVRDDSMQPAHYRLKTQAGAGG